MSEDSKVTKIDLSIMEQMDYETFVRIISDIPSCIFFKDKDLRYRFSSHCWMQLMTDDIVGKTDTEVRKDTDNAIRAMEEDRKIIKSKKGCKYTIKSDIDGEISYLELIKEPILDSEGEVLGIVGLINDVTEKTIMQKRIVDMSMMQEVQCRELEASNNELKATLEKVEQMHEAQKLLTASMNHELRSPLNGIIGNLQLLMEDENINDEQQEIVKNAFWSSQLMLGIVNELLDYAKLETGSFSIRHDVFELSVIIHNIELMYSNQARAKGLDFKLIKDDSLKDSYIGDETRILQVINNFTSNAIKYTDVGSVTLRISYEEGYLVISCSDTGQGLSKESIDSLFTPFVRFNEKKNVHIQGTGLGLSVVKRIIDNMKGKISVESKEGVGSTFTAMIPVDLADADANEVREYTDFDNYDFGRLKALCVDDSNVNVMVMASHLKRIGMGADVACSGAEGIAKADENKYDVIFLDHMMPGMDGIEVYRTIRDRSTKNSDTPVVMMTGNADDSFVSYYKEQGLDGYLLKPILKEHIMNMVVSVVK